jgi:hypothetical protein
MTQYRSQHTPHDPRMPPAGDRDTPGLQQCRDYGKLV